MAAADTKATDAKTETKAELFKAGVYMNQEPRMINLPALEEGNESRHVPPGGNVELTAEDTANKHIHHFIKNKFLIPAESAEAKAARDAAEIEQAKLDAAAAEAAAAKK